MADKERFMNHEVFAQRLRVARGNMSVKKVAEKLCIRDATYRRYEAANGIFPGPDILIKIADLFDETIDYLLGRTDI